MQDYFLARRILFEQEVLLCIEQGDLAGVRQAYQSWRDFLTRYPQADPVAYGILTSNSIEWRSDAQYPELRAG